MFERFSASYYLGRLYVQPTAGGVAAIHHGDHRRTNEQLYATGEGVERLDAPLVMKFDGRGAHFPVVGDADVPSGTLAVPGHLSDDRVPGRREVLLASADRARELLRYSGYDPDAALEAEPDAPDADDEPGPDVGR
jgi:hypothetical protein